MERSVVVETGIGRNLVRANRNRVAQDLIGAVVDGETVQSQVGVRIDLGIAQRIEYRRIGDHHAADRNHVVALPGQLPEFANTACSQVHTMKIIKVVTADNLLTRLVTHAAEDIDGIVTAAITYRREIARTDRIATKTAQNRPFVRIEVIGIERLAVAHVAETAKKRVLSLLGIEPGPVMMQLHRQMGQTLAAPPAGIQIEARHRTLLLRRGRIVLRIDLVGIKLAASRIDEIRTEPQIDRTPLRKELPRLAGTGIVDEKRITIEVIELLVAGIVVRSGHTRRGERGQKSPMIGVVDEPQGADSLTNRPPPLIVNQLATAFRKCEKHTAGITDGEIADGKRRNIDDMIAATKDHHRAASVAHRNARCPERAVIDRKSDRVSLQVERQFHPEPLDVGQFPRVDRGGDQAAAPLVIEPEEDLRPLSVVEEIVDSVIGVVLDTENIADLFLGIERKVELQIETARIGRRPSRKDRIGSTLVDRGPAVTKTQSLGADKSRRQHHAQ